MCEYETKEYRSVCLRFVRYLIQTIVLVPFLHCVLKIKVKGKRNATSKNSPLIIIANHQSHFDAPLIIASLPRRQAVRVAVGAAADNFFKNRWQSLPTRILLNTYPIDRDHSSAHKGLTKKLIDDHISILVFPEGTRTRTGQMGAFHQGLARIALATGARILPVVIKGTYAAWPCTQKRWSRSRHDVTVEFLPLIVPSSNETAAQLTARMYDTIKRKLNQ